MIHLTLAALTLSLPECLMKICKYLCTYTWCYLFFKILQNEIWKSGRNLPLATFGSERVNLILEVQEGTFTK